MESAFQCLVDKWPSTFVARSEVKNFSGGALTEGYLANLDSQGKGPKGRVRCGRKILYPVNELVEWLEARSEVLTERKK